jgi:plasmid stabilization system protein ParE
MASIENAIFALREFPARYTLVSEPMFAQRGYRKAEVGGYLIFYRISGNAIEIMRVLHGAQDYFRLLH